MSNGLFWTDVFGICFQAGTKCFETLSELNGFNDIFVL